MIRVTIEERNQQIQAFTVEGHANAGEYGKDLVCAAVSAVTIGTVNAIEKLASIEPHVEMNQDGGFLRFIAPTNVDDETRTTIELLLRAMVVSLETIALENEKYLKITHQ